MDTLSVDSALPQEELQPESSLLSLVYIRSQAIVSRRIAGETLLVPVRGKVGDLASIYSFNGTGTLLWECLASHQTLADLVDAVEREYAVEREQAEQDVQQFLKDAISVGLVEAREQVNAAAINSVVHPELHAAGGD
jgi:hypothetical protein